MSEQQFLISTIRRLNYHEDNHVSARLYTKFAGVEDKAPRTTISVDIDPTRKGLIVNLGEILQ